MTEEERREGRGERERRGEIMFWLDSEERQTKHVYHNVNNTQSQPASLDRRNNSILSTKCDFDRHFSERGERKVLVLTCNLDWWCRGEEAEETLKTYLTYDKCHKLNFLRRDEH